MNIRIRVFLLVSVFAAAGFASGGSAAVLPTVDDVDSKAGSDQAALQPNDFVIHFSSTEGDRSKFITYGWNGFAGKLIRWRYNDANRNASFSASPADAVARLQTAMGKWSSTCNISFQYDGTTSSPASLSTGSSDGINVIAWGSLSGNTTGVTYVSASGPAPAGPFTVNEGDIVLNNAFNPNVDVTMLHEIGHLLGLDHSDVQSAVMSGPPLTTYASLNALTADDIAGCRALYGAPVVTTVAITGSITNGGGIANVNFCARPSTGVSCTASNASGAYSCTVPNGWSGTLHSPSVSGNRIPPQVFASVTAATTRNITALSGVPSCNLDVDNNGLIEPTTDGAAILSRMLGMGAAAFNGLAGTCAANTTGTAIFNATNSNYNVTGGASTFASTDGLVILRAMSGKTGTDVTNGLGLTREPGATNTSWAAIQSWLNSTCGSNF